MRELSLFTGAGGGLLGTKLLGWEPIGYVEFNDYCQRVIKQRIIDGVLPNAPIFGDIRAFISEGYAEAYQGLVDVITGGFPCQPFSNAGKRLGADDHRNMWPATIDCIRIIRPRYTFLENVPGLVTSGYFGTILSDLHQSGYDCRWRILSAAEMGAPHKRDRLWLMANTTSFRCSKNKEQHGHGNRSVSAKKIERWMLELERMDSDGKDSIIRHRLSSGDRRGDDGLAIDMDRLKAIGNGQVPTVAATAWRILSGNIN